MVCVMMLYCGHTLSRLKEIRHNRTKQTGFPTIEEGKSMYEELGDLEHISSFSGLVILLEDAILLALVILVL
jgi:hypothetical protein